MPVVTRGSPRPPGEMLARIARRLFRGTPAVVSLEALIADAQHEWLLCDRRAAHRLRGILLVSFWRATVAEAGRLLLLSDRHVLRMTIEFAAFSFAGGVGMLLLIPGDNPAFVVGRDITDFFVMLCVPAAFMFHPSNVAKRLSPTTAPGWWPFGQFLVIWLTAFSIWLVLIDGGFGRLLGAIGFAVAGVVVSSLSHWADPLER